MVNVVSRALPVLFPFFLFSSPPHCSPRQPKRVFPLIRAAEEGRKDKKTPPFLFSPPLSFFRSIPLAHALEVSDRERDQLLLLPCPHFFLFLLLFLSTRAAPQNEYDSTVGRAATSFFFLFSPPFFLPPPLSPEIRVS